VREKFTRTANFMMGSVRVLRDRPRLLILPAAATVLSLAELFGLYGLAVLAGSDDNFRAMIRQRSVRTVIQLGPRGTLLAAFALLCIHITATFMQATVAAAVLQRGGDGRISSALAVSRRRWRDILSWSLLAATVIVVANLVRSALGFPARFLPFIPKLLWAFAAFFAIPIIVAEDKGSWAALHGSAALFSRTWGEETAAGFTYLVVSALAAIIIAGSTAAAWLLGGEYAAVLVLIVLYLSWQSLLTTLIAIFQVALYRYAVEGVPPRAFERTPLSQAYGRTGQPVHS
jgi:hypothetical protein